MRERLERSKCAEVMETVETASVTGKEYIGCRFRECSLRPRSAYTTRTVKAPMPSISSSIRSPLSTAATPEGVPDRMTSPAASSK